jgi:hypothetical protein
VPVEGGQFAWYLQVGTEIRKLPKSSYLTKSNIFSCFTVFRECKFLNK